MRESTAPMWRNRIVGRGEEAPDQLLANPANGWKIHTTEQQDETEKIFETVGWVREVLVNRRTGHMVDGHMRVQLAMRHNEETVPVTYIDISEAEERLLIATLDPTAAMSGRDDALLDTLLQDIAADFPHSDIDFDAILAPGKKRVKGLAHDVKKCTCCEKRCKVGCGCHRE